MRPGLSGLSQMQLIYGANGNGSGGNGNGQDAGTSCPCPKGQCLANPVIQEVSALPSGTSAPNTVITEHAIHTLGLHDQRLRLAHPGPAPADRRADHRRQAHRRRGRA